MARELPRTLYTLQAPYQTGLDSGDIEIVVVDNGSHTRPLISNDVPWLTNLQVSDPGPSPVRAINEGLAQANADFVGVMIDGARMASPGMLASALQASRLSPRAVVTTMAYHLGPDLQMKSVRDGYDAAAEDRLLDSVPWRENGYELFNISVLAGSSKWGWFLPIGETNAIFMSKALWTELGGFDPGFQSAGGGLANLDAYVRACELPGSVLVRLLGEGTFHQVHGGIATNQRREDATWSVFHEEYVRLRGKPFKKPTRTPILLGELRPEHKRVLEVSTRAFLEHA